MRTFVAIALAGLLAGCSSGGAGQGPTDRGPVVPWDGTVPTQLQPSTVAPATACRAGQLRVVGPGFAFAPTLAGGSGTVTVRNAGPAACRLTGRPTVRLVGARPTPPQRDVALPAQQPEFPNLAAPDTTLLALPPGGMATLAVDWRNWCLPSDGGAKPVPPRAVRISLPGARGELDAEYNAVPQCDAPGRPSTLGVHPWQPAPLPTTPPWSATAVLAKIEPLDGPGPIVGRRGAVVRYAVRLRNPGTAPVTFERCPLVVEMLAPSGSVEGHQLNCAAAGVLAAKGSVRFEMRIRVPVDAPIGPNGLFWELDPTGAQGPEAVGRVIVGRS